MIITKQPKKSNNNIRYSLGNNSHITSQITGKVIKKNKPIKQKLHKNLSQLPIGLLNESKQNASLSNLMIPRPHSSLIASDISRSLSREKERVDLNSFCKDKIKLKKIQSKRNTLSIVDVPMKTRKICNASHSNKKWNNRSVEEDPNLLKFMMAQNRKKYNLSCGDMIQSKSKMKQNTQKIAKKKSIPVAGKSIKNPSKKTIIKPAPENQIKNFKPVHLGYKSKGSTTMINPNQVIPKGKKKQKQNKQNKKKQQRSKSKSKSKNKNKNKKSKSNKMFVLFKGDSDDQKSVDPQYPTNKYVDMKKKAKKSLNIKVGLDYNFSCLNLGSNSSGIINQEYSSSIQPNKLNKSNQQGYSEYDGTDSINIEEIKHYEEHSPIKNRISVRLDRHKKLRNEIYGQLQEQYPYLNSTQLQFLSSIVLIQRKWRQVLLFRRLDQRRLIITQYLEEPENEKELKNKIKKQKQKNSSQKNRFGDKTQLSRTKVGQFQLQQEQKQQTKTQAKSKIEPPEEEGDLSEKNTKNEVIIFLNDESDDEKNKTNQKKRQFEETITDRKPMTQANKVVVNYSWIATKQVFPQVSYLEYRKNILRQSFEKTMKSISQQRHSHSITEKQFEWKKRYIIENYEKDLQQLKKAKHDIKKGFLKYIDCINKIKELKNPNDPTNKLDNKYGLRKVSSDSNFLSSLYEKIFKFDNCLSEWSGGSESIEMLTKRILIRKQFFKGDKKSYRKSLSDIRSSAKSSYEMIRTSREGQNNTLMIFEQTDRMDNFQIQQNDSQQLDLSSSKNVKQFKFSNQIFRQIQQSKNKQHKKLKQQSKESPKDNKDNKDNKDKDSEKKFRQQPCQNISKLNYSVGLISHKEEILSKIEDQVILELAKELQKDIHRINPVLMDIILINQPSVSQLDEQDVEDDDDDFKSPAMSTIQRELQTIGSPRNIQNIYSETEPNQIMDYLYGLVAFINKKSWGRDILYNMNNNQTFQPSAYLKFLRDFQIPDDEYTPIINNERFIEWQAFYSTKISSKKQYSQKEVQILKQSEAIFHRCVFQVFLGELQKNRPYGERGRPFPWQQKYSYTTIRQIAEEQFSQVVQKSVNKIQQYLVYKCGLITEKFYIINEDQLERAHEENEGRIIQMLEQDLTESSHQWYEVEQHLLEIKLELSYTIEQLILEQVQILLKQFSVR